MARKGRILLINAVNEVTRERAQSFIRESHQVKILKAYRDFKDQDGFVALATLGQIGLKGYSLAIPLYVAGAKAADIGGQIGVIDALANWRAAAAVSDAAISDTLNLLRAEVLA